MEKAKKYALDNAKLQVIKDAYERAFEVISKGQTADEAQQKEQAVVFYKEGRQLLLRALNVPSQGDECVGSSWESARHMQREMQETLNNITIRLAILETSSDVGWGPVPTPTAVSGTGNADTPSESQNPTKQKPERPSSLLLGNHGKLAGAVGGLPVLDSVGMPLLPTIQSVVPGKQLPAYSPLATDGHLTVSYGTDAGEMSLVEEDLYSHMSASSRSLQSMGEEEGEEVFFLAQGVQIFFVTPEGQVSVPSYPGFLRLVKFTCEPSKTMPNRPPAFLQVCDWLYPLTAKDSPVLVCNTGVFMFPDMMAPAPGSYVGVVLSSELPNADRELFKDLLAQMTDLRSQAPDEVAEAVNLSQTVPIAPPKETSAATAEEEKTLPEWSEKVSSGILTGASWLSRGLVKGAKFSGKAIHMGASKLREHITPANTPTNVSPVVKQRLLTTKQVTEGAVKVSQLLTDGVCVVTNCAGQELAQHVKKHGSKLIPESVKKDKNMRSNLNGAMAVAASGVLGFATIWTGLEVAAKNIIHSVASETVTTVKHKYGAAVGQATDQAVNSAINVGVTVFNVNHLGIKAVVKRTSKEAAKTILEDLKLQKRPEN